MGLSSYGLSANLAQITNPIDERVGKWNRQKICNPEFKAQLQLLTIALTKKLKLIANNVVTTPKDFFINKNVSDNTISSL